MSVAPARAAALEVLGRVRVRQAFGHETLSAALAERDLSAEDAALATRLAYGTLQYQGTLDEAVNRFADRPGSVEPVVRDILRLATYEILMLRTPHRAAVHQAVEAVRDVRPHAAPFANAVLRALVIAAPGFPWGDVKTDDAALARQHGHPLWLAEMWIRELGREKADDAMSANNEPAPLYLAYNPFAGSWEDAHSALTRDGAEPGACPVQGCIEAGVASAAVRGAALRDGLVVVADAAAQLAPVVAGSAPGGVVVDVGAGRGTKTLLLQAQNAGLSPARIVAIDVHTNKARRLGERMCKLGVPGVTAISADARDPGLAEGLPPPGSADLVLVDAPCTGLGTLRRHPEKRWRVTPEDGVRLGALGREMLDGMARLVRVGGRMVYSTCTIAHAENDAVVDGFLSDAEGRGFEAESLRESVPPEWHRFLVGDRFQSVPESGGADGHYIAAMVRKG